ncbi:MAG: ABC transporter substrate-binding protein [Xanthobacteraceae bacterium]|nr:ABC transporter substrate-binding protein [Xanthobacteraceae bacterium]MBV9631121.1 ABC transporter substrate-binding protein [Xanthobacteraceae bacterium]
MKISLPMRRLVSLALVAAGLTIATPRFIWAQPQPGRTYKVGFSQLVDHPALNATRQGFIDGLKAGGLEVGKNLDFDYQNAQGDVGTARSIAEKFVADGIDLLAPCTTPVVQATIRVAKDSKTPVVFGCVTNPTAVGVLQSLDKPTGTNVTGFYTVPPVPQNFDLFLAIRPGLKTIGTIYNSGETNSEALNKLAKAEAEKRGIAWQAVTITSSAEVKNAIDALIGKVDAVVTLQDSTVASAYEPIVKATRDAKVPWFAFDVLAVPRGAIAALAQHQYQNGVDWARKVAVPVLLGKDPGTLLAVEATVFETQINAGAAKAVGLSVPESILKQASKVYE